MNSLKRFFGQNVLARNTLWLFAGDGVRLSLQIAYFILIARSLGVAEYGAFVGAVALVAIVAPFSSCGTSFLLLKQVSRDRSTFAQYWGAGLVITAVAGCVLLCLVLLVSHFVWGHSVPFKVLLLVGISDVIVVRVIDLAVRAFMAVEVLQRSAEMSIVLSVTRVAAALGLKFAVHSPTATSWALLYLLSTSAATIYSILAVTRAFGLPSMKLRLSAAEIKEGFYFAVSQASQTVYNDIDKTMLVRFGGLEATGIYGAAYRIIDASFAPVSAVVGASAARFFRHGKSGITGSTEFAKKLLPYTAGYGLLAAVLLLVVSPVLPVILGKGFATATLALRWLSPLVLLKSIHYFFADSLSAAGHQGLRASVQLGILGLNVLLNLWLIPAYSWRGAAWASLASDAALAISLFVAIVSLRRKDALMESSYTVVSKVAL